MTCSGGACGALRERGPCSGLSLTVGEQKDLHLTQVLQTYTYSQGRLVSCLPVAYHMNDLYLHNTLKDQHCFIDSCIHAFVQVFYYILVLPSLMLGPHPDISDGYSLYP